MGSAGLAAGVSLVLGAAGLTIALIGAAAMSSSASLTPALGVDEVARVRWLWITPAMTLVVSMWALMQVVLRRPLLTSESTARRWPVTNSTIGVAAFVVGVCVVLATWSMVLSFDAMRSAGAGSITDSSSFSGLGLRLGGMGFPLAMLSSLLLLRWWQGEGLIRSLPKNA